MEISEVITIQMKSCTLTIDPKQIESCQMLHDLHRCIEITARSSSCTYHRGYMEASRSVYTVYTMHEYGRMDELIGGVIGIECFAMVIEEEATIKEFNVMRESIKKARTLLFKYQSIHGKTKVPVS